MSITSYVNKVLINFNNSLKWFYYIPVFNWFVDLYDPPNKEDNYDVVNYEIEATGSTEYY